MDQKRQSRIFYGWFVFAACFLMVFTCLGFCSGPKGLYLAAITEDLGIPRSLFSMNDSARFIATAVTNFFFGFLIAKFGARKLVVFGFLSLIASMLIYSFATTVPMFVAGGFLLGLGLAWTTTTMVGYLVERWFAGNKGTIMGIALAASGLGGAVSSQFVNAMIYNESLGWRVSYRITAGIVAAVGVIAVLVIRSRPEEMGLKPMEDRFSAKKKKNTQNWEGISLKEAMKKPYFYVALLCIYLTGMALQSVNGVSSAHMKDCGIDPDSIANLLSLMSLVLMFSKMSTGFCFDRFGLRATLLFCVSCGAVAISMLAMVSNTLMAAIYSVIIPFALPLETIMLPLIAMDLFGHRAYSKIMGIFVSVNTFGYATGTPLMNLMFDLTGTYRPTMLVLVVILIGVGITMQFVITAARKTRTAA
ncbi:MAG: MFS transporter [Oscillospiraceae bacterium]|nr:MFS transporter [Oscillospiraceae bacterium]